MTLYLGDCIERMRELSEASVDAVVTDPPYGLHFMGKTWDSFGGPLGRGVGRERSGGRERGRAMHAGEYDLRRNSEFQAWCEAWASEALRILKPGGHLLAFGGTRTYHRLASGVEDAGFEVRDCLAWLYGSGFPKSLNLDGAWQGWGTALKPAHEPVILARKPLVGTVSANVVAHGTGALNIDGCRIGVTDDAYARNHSGDRGHAGTRTTDQEGATDLHTGGGSAHDAGRWPANVVLDDQAAAMLDEQTGELTSGANPTRRGSDKFRTAYGDFEGQRECVAARGLVRGGASRFFYCAKASRAERNAGLDGFDERKVHPDEPNGRVWDITGSHSTARANHHPTVKPIALMRWLVRLATPPGGLVLDPFLGSGTTGIAALLEGFRFVGIEQDPDYLAIARARIAHHAAQPSQLDLLGGAA